MRSIAMAVLLAIFNLSAVIAVAGDYIPREFHGWYRPANTPEDHCNKPEIWDDNFRVSGRTLDFVDGACEFSDIIEHKLDQTFTINMTCGSEGKRYRQTEIWKRQADNGGTLLVRTLLKPRHVFISRYCRS